MATLKQKVLISLLSSFTFISLNLPIAYKLTSNLISTYDNGCPTNIGFMFHTFLFFIITYLSMGNPLKKSLIKLKRTIHSSLIYFLIASPILFMLIGSNIGNNFASDKGCPTNLGVFLHSIGYFLCLFGIMYLPEEN